METKGDNPVGSQLNKESDEGAIDNKTLSELFDNGFKMYNDINKSSEPTNGVQIQTAVKRVMHIFENATKMVSLLDMFSSNESFEDITTEDIKYFLLPALLGTLTTKICGADNRMHIVEVAEIYFIDFLKRLKSYGIIDIEIPKINNEKIEDGTVSRKKTEAELITEMVNKRNTKIQRYQEQKELEKKLDVLRNNLDNPNIDDETKREYFLTLVKVFASQAIDELSSLIAEKPILEHMMAISRDPEANNTGTPKHREPATKLKPIIITRDVVQKQVYGAGYPSLPVMTVEEFYDKKVRDGEWPENAQRNQIGSKSLQDVASGKVNEELEKDREDEEEEDLIEKDDPETLARARARDEYKDNHRRGWGNRHNRS